MPSRHDSAPAAQRPAAAVLPLALGARARARARSGPRRGAARRLPRRRGGLRDQAQRQPRPRAARVRRRAAGQRRALHRHGHAGGAGAASAGSAAGWARCARCSPTPAARTPPPAGAGSTTPPRRRAPRRSRSGVEPAEVALASTGGISHYLPVDAMLKGILDARGELRRDGDGGLPAGDPDDRRVREARQPGGRAVRRTGAAERPVQGRGDDLAALRDDAVLRRDRRRAGARDGRAAARRVREALLRPRLGRRAAVDERHRDPDVLGRERRAASLPRARTSCASARRSTRCCASWRS